MTTSPSIWRTNCDGRPREISLDRPRALAIINLTPDSFSDGGSYPTIDAATAAVEAALRDGAIGIDVGGESTRPGSQPVSAQVQIDRTAPAIAAFRRRLGDGFLISIDTTLSPVAAAAFDAGADALNDTSAGRDDADMFPLVARRGAGLILMHRLALPQRDQFSTQYAPSQSPAYAGGVVAVVRDFLRGRASLAEQAGAARDSIVLDPGLGFGKTVEQNLELIRASTQFVALGYPVLSALSRKSFVGHVSGVPGDAPLSERLAGTIALSVLHFLHAARLFRVHDVEPAVRALAAADACAR